ncbi:hypothetical protein CTI12_AA285610 [Artemisia annua]|uniref:4Fe-4S ferredoxin-type domain-containing protein n=1 Tax=Artemisia annua TaxID=35608 RepID=A0A2U1NBP0_ARTAN|nr:hypothetical protein CTI12_AA285610 [Artemisia annua]
MLLCPPTIEYEYQCVMCPEGKCSPDCPTLDVLPYKEPVAEENIKKARKLVALGMDARYIKDTLKIAGELDGVDGKNELIKMWLLEYDSKPKEKDPLLVLIENRKILAQKQKIIEELNASLAADYGVPDPAPVVDDEGLPGLKKCTSNN